MLSKVFNCQVLTKKLLKIKQKNELNKLKTFDLSYFIDKSYFEEDGTQNYLVFQPLNKSFKLITNKLSILSWQSKRLSTENIDPPTTSLFPSINYVGNKIRVKFSGSCLKQSNKLTYTHKKIVNICIVYERGASSSDANDPTQESCLFGAVTKNSEIDKYRFSGYGIEFDGIGRFSFPGGGVGQNLLICGADMSSSAYIDNKKNDILVVGIGPTQGLEQTLTVEKCTRLILL